MRTAIFLPATAEPARAVDPHRLGIAFSAVLGGSHLAWAVAVLVGCAQPILDFIFWLHFIEPPYQVRPFAWENAVGLVAVTSGIGYALGVFAGKVWNRLERGRT